MIMVRFSVTDDSGFLALFDPDAYLSFVSSDWTWEQITQHFQDQMRERHLLIWGTGLEGFWNVEVRMNHTPDQGFRQVTGSIRVSKNRLALINYEGLTMGAQFEDIKLPEEHQADLVIEVQPGLYQCRIVQNFNPEERDGLGRNRVDFAVELEPTNNELPPWDRIPWFET